MQCPYTQLKSVLSAACRPGLFVVVNAYIVGIIEHSRHTHWRSVWVSSPLALNSTILCLILYIPNIPSFNAFSQWGIPMKRSAQPHSATCIMKPSRNNSLWVHPFIHSFFALSLPIWPRENNLCTLHVLHLRQSIQILPRKKDAEELGDCIS